MLSERPAPVPPRDDEPAAGPDERPAPEVAVSARSAARARCGYCHDDVRGEDAWTCPACVGRLHAECLQAHGRCPTIGCAVLAPRPAPAVVPPAPASRGLDHVVAQAATGLVVLPVALVVLALFVRSGSRSMALAGLVAGLLLLGLPIGWWIVSSWLLGAFGSSGVARERRLAPEPPRRAALAPGPVVDEPAPRQPWRVEDPRRPVPRRQAEGDPPRPAPWRVDDEPAPPWTPRRLDPGDAPHQPWRADG